MNLRGKGTVSLSKTPLEWASLRSAGQILCPVCYMREGGINEGKESGWEGKRLHGSVIREEAVGTGLVFFFCVFFSPSSDSRAHSTPFDSIP